MSEIDPATARPSGTFLADGEWHRLHPASPLLKGGIALIAILGVVVANLRERIFDMFVPHIPQEDDPIDFIVNHGLIVWALIVVAIVLVVLTAGFYASWRMHLFRITDEVVEVRSGILFRTNRKARLDRIQGINIIRPFIARLFGAAKLEINQAGQDANVQLSYLRSAAADDLRREILRLASGTRRVATGDGSPEPSATGPGGTGPGGAALAQAGPGGAGLTDTRGANGAAGTAAASGTAASGTAGTAAAASGAAASGAAGQSVIERRVSEFLAPELDPDAAPPESVVKLDLGRLIGSMALSGSTVFLLIVVAGAIAWIITTGEFFALFFALPGAIGFGSYYIRRFTKSLRYSIAGTPDGIRVGFGLLSTSNETLPPGRIHSVQVSQPLMWRAPGWWEIKVNRAGHSSTKGADGQANTTILPVGDRDDVRRVLELMLPELLAQSVESVPAAGEAIDSAISVIESGLESRGGPDDGFTNSPRRAAVLRWFSWRRNGFAITTGSLVLRKGAIWRQLVIVPQPRLQSVSLHQGPLLRPLKLASVHLHTVSGPISAQLGAIDRDAAVKFFEDVARVAVSAAHSDTTHRWRAGEQQA
ncbi:MAG: PH domain-containing protein [Cryobacterium sp.]|nr:PH domain-containing protein [Cryobacterium sp.]